MNNNNNRFSEIMVGIFMLMLGISFLGGGNAFWPMILLVMGIYLLTRQFEGGDRTSAIPRTRSRQSSRADYEEQPEQASHESIYRHALESIEAAGLDPDSAQVLPTDIGVMVFKDDGDPMIHRTRPIINDVDYIQPFVQLRLPTRAVGRIRFEIIDSDGQTLFLREDERQLERGRNLVMPGARLAIHDAQAMHGPWELHISADGMLLASHRFEWQESTSQVIRRHLSEDGEINNELRAALAENRLQQLSLDELLADQDEAIIEEQRRRARR